MKSIISKSACQAFFILTTFSYQMCAVKHKYTFSVNRHVVYYWGYYYLPTTNQLPTDHNIMNRLWLTILTCWFSQTIDRLLSQGSISQDVCAKCKSLTALQLRQPNILLQPFLVPTSPVRHSVHARLFLL